MNNDAKILHVVGLLAVVIVVFALMGWIYFKYKTHLDVALLVNVLVGLIIFHLLVGFKTDNQSITDKLDTLDEKVNKLLQE